MQAYARLPANPTKGEDVSDFDVLMLNPMPPLVVEKLAAGTRLHKLWEAKDRAAELARIAPHVRGIASGSGHTRIDAALMSTLPALEIVGCFGVGYDQVDAAWAGEHGIVVTHTPDVLNEEVADTAFGLLLNAVRQLPQADRYVRAGKWLEKPFPLTASLRGRTMGILGLGRIGKAIAKRAEAFGLKVIYHGRHRQADVAWPYYADLVEMARACDILVLIAPGGAETKHIVDARVLDALGPNGILVNVARGSLVDEDALIAALRDRTILAAGLDVFANEPNVPQALIDLPNTVLLPHVASASVHTRNAMADLVADNIFSWFDEARPLTPVPETNMVSAKR